MNNYDQSSSGENITLDVYYDSDLAGIYFNEFSENADRIDLGGRDNYLYLIGDSSAPFFKKSQLTKMKRAELLELCDQYDLGIYDDETKSVMISDLLTVTIKQHYQYLASQYSWHGIREYIPHDWYISRGYCQGDAVLIVSISEPIDKEYLDHIFWDAPVSVRAEINDVDYYEDSFLDDEYKYDKDAVILKVQALEISDYAKNWIIEHLPEHPAYN